MEHLTHFGYPWGHETTRNPATTGAASPTGHPVGAAGKIVVGRSADSGGFEEFGVAVGGNLSAPGARRSAAPTDSRSSGEADASPEATPRKAAAGGASSRRLCDRVVDPEAHRSVDPETLWCRVSPQPSVAVVAPLGMELPETGAPGLATQRSGDRPLEAVPLAAYKKTPQGLGPIWSFWMNRASCSFPTSRGHGHRRDRPRCCTIPTSRTVSRRSVPWRCPPSAGTWRFICSFVDATSTDWMYAPLLSICSDTCEDPSCCCGIGDRFTAGKKYASSVFDIPAFTWKSFRPTPLNSTRRSMCGTKPIGRSTTPLPRIRTSFMDSCDNRCDACEALNAFSGPVSMPRIYPGSEDRSITYAKVNSTRTRSGQPHII